MWAFEKIASVLDFGTFDVRAGKEQMAVPDTIATQYLHADDYSRRRALRAIGYEFTETRSATELAADRDLAQKVGEAYVTSLQEFLDRRDAQRLAEAMG